MFVLSRSPSAVTRTMVNILFLLKILLEKLSWKLCLMLWANLRHQRSSMKLILRKLLSLAKRISASRLRSLDSLHQQFLGSEMVMRSRSVREFSFPKMQVEELLLLLRNVLDLMLVFTQPRDPMKLVNVKHLALSLSPRLWKSQSSPLFWDQPRLLKDHQSNWRVRWLDILSLRSSGCTMIKNGNLTTTGSSNLSILMELLGLFLRAQLEMIRVPMLPLLTTVRELLAHWPTLLSRHA